LFWKNFRVGKINPFVPPNFAIVAAAFLSLSGGWSKAMGDDDAVVTDADPVISPTVQ
jgi:hypothetical protein